MRLLRLGMDIDGVIVDYASVMLPILSGVCNRSISYDDLICWDIGEALDIDEKMVADVWQQILGSDILRPAAPIRGAIAGLSALSKHEIWLVTARPTSLQSLTVSWLNEKKVKYDRLLFDNGTDRHSIGQELDVFVEDHLEQACAIAEAGVSTLLLDQPWNQTAILPENCKRVTDWSAIVLSISALEEAG